MPKARARGPRSPPGLKELRGAIDGVHRLVVVATLVFSYGNGCSRTSATSPTGLSSERRLRSAAARVARSRLKEQISSALELPSAGADGSTRPRRAKVLARGQGVHGEPDGHPRSRSRATSCLSRRSSVRKPSPWRQLGWRGVASRGPTRARVCALRAVREGCATFHRETRRLFIISTSRRARAVRAPLREPVRRPWLGRVPRCSALHLTHRSGSRLPASPVGPHKSRLVSRW